MAVSFSPNSAKASCDPLGLRKTWPLGRAETQRACVSRGHVAQALHLQTGKASPEVIWVNARERTWTQASWYPARDFIPQLMTCSQSLRRVRLFVTPWTSLPGSSAHGDSPGKNTEVSCHALLQGIFPTQESNPGLPHCRRIIYCLSHREAHTCWLIWY